MGICEFIARATGEPSMRLCSTDSPHTASGNGHATITAAIDFHSFGQLVLGGWAHTNQPTPSMLKNENIGRMMVEKMKPQVGFSLSSWEVLVRSQLLFKKLPKRKEIYLIRPAVCRCLCMVQAMQAV